MPNSVGDDKPDSLTVNQVKPKSQRITAHTLRSGHLRPSNINSLRFTPFHPQTRRADRHPVILGAPRAESPKEPEYEDGKPGVDVGESKGQPAERAPRQRAELLSLCDGQVGSTSQKKQSNEPENPKEGAHGLLLGLITHQRVIINELGPPGLEPGRQSVAPASSSDPDRGPFASIRRDEHRQTALMPVDFDPRPRDEFADLKIYRLGPLNDAQPAILGHDRGGVQHPFPGALRSGL